MSDTAKTLLDIAMLAQIEGQDTKARKLRNAAKFIEDLDVQVMTLERRVVDLENGACRYNCRLKSVMWKAGFTWGFVRAHKSRAAVGDLDKQYDKWRKENDNR